MTAMLKIAMRVIQRRVAAGEKLDAVLLDYHKMTPTEVAEIRAALG